MDPMDKYLITIALIISWFIGLFIGVKVSSYQWEESFCEHRLESQMTARDTLLFVDGHRGCMEVIKKAK